MKSGEVVRAALLAATLDDARAVQAEIERAIGGRHQRPLGDTANNYGLMSSGGSFDVKTVELVTNMQDAVLERRAIQRYGSNVPPFRNPRDAACELLKDVVPSELADMVCVEFRESDHPTGSSRRLTAVFRDHGCGLTASAVPETVFRLGSPYKESRLYLQGAFGLGGATTYRNAKAVVLVTRRAPELLRPGEADRVVVAVVEWERHTKGEGAFYLVTTPWTSGKSAVPWSVPAAEVPEFEPGTHVALISYAVDGFHRARLGDERSFDTVLNTRLWDPISPVRFRNAITDRDRKETLRGLRRRLEDNSRAEWGTGRDTLPFAASEKVYHLPIRFWLFAAAGEPGERRKYVAKDHAVVFTSNGQVHHHWTPADFRARTRLNRLHDRVLVVIDTDELPIDVRTSLFTADRSQLVRNEAAVRLESAVEAFLNEWDALRDENSRLVRESLQPRPDESTLSVARRIGRALRLKGFSAGGKGNSGGGKGPGGGGGGGGVVPQAVELHADPTFIRGPRSVTAVVGETRFIGFTVDAVDEFFASGRGAVAIALDGDRLSSRCVTVGMPSRGKVRVSLAVPADTRTGTVRLTASIDGWHRSSGGIGERLEWTVDVELIAEAVPRGVGRGRPKGGESGDAGAAAGGLPVIQWKSEDNGWTQETVGSVELVEAAEVARSIPVYAELSALGRQQIPVVSLNEEFRPLKDYLSSRARALVDLSRPRDEYAAGVGVQLLVLQQEVERRREEGRQVDEEFLSTAHRAAALGVLCVMPSFEELFRELESAAGGSDA